MVYIYELSVQDAKYQILAPQSPHENTQMIQYGIPSDLCFSAQGAKYLPVYLRQPDVTKPLSSLSLEDVPQQAVRQCCDILKHLANVKRDVTVTYTYVSNLTLNGPQNPSQVQTTVSKTKRTGPVASPELVATQKQKNVDFEMERATYDKEVRALTSEQFRKNQKEELENSKVYKAIAEQKNRGYTDLFADEEALQSSSNQNRTEDWEDDFM